MYRTANHNNHLSPSEVDHVRIKAAALQAQSNGIDELWVYLEFGRLLFFAEETKRLSSGFVCTLGVDSILRGLPDDVWNDIDDALALLRTDHHNN